ncbi:hypothetical protein BRC65_06190 [Halobacteriales archaeon QH_2_65_14]|nr:MAG: hypothetical protein BRC65_06190 [Halobacteriales archaeon QH_2_65_14]
MATVTPSRVFGRRDVRLLAVAVLVELLLLALYFAVRPERPTNIRYTLYPFVWLNVGLLAVINVDVPSASRRHRLVAVAVAGLYFLFLLALAGLVGLFPSDELLWTVSTLEVEPGSPGLERVHLVTATFYVSFVTFRTFGFLVLSYLVYVTVLDVSGGLAAGALGVFSCVGCAFPVLVSLSAGLFGSTAIASAVYGAQFDISTAVFVLAVALLYWQPGFGRLAAKFES